MIDVRLEVVAIDCGNDNVIVPGPFVILTWSVVPVEVFSIGALPVLPTIISPLFKTLRQCYQNLWTVHYLHLD